MRCIRCHRDWPRDVAQCMCGFRFDDVPPAELPGWFDETRDALQQAYLAVDTPWQQSGKSGTYEEWVRLRIPISEAITRSGSLLDMGCANGFLLACVLEWTAAKGLDITPYGLDFSPALIELARQRLSGYADSLWVGNVLDWQPPNGQRFDMVRTSVEYVPRNLHQDALHHALHLVKPGGKLLVAQYRSRRDDLSTGWIDEYLKTLGFTVSGMTHGFSSQGLPLCRVAIIERDAA